MPNLDRVTDAMADAANQAMSEYIFGPVEPMTRRELGIARQAMKVAIATALDEEEEGEMVGTRHGPKVKTLTERFWSKVEKGDGCWEWSGYICKQSGYGKISMRPNAPTGAHRVSWMLHNGEIPEGMYICHHCDNRKCVRPDHLFLGTPSDNLRDMVSKGRDRPWPRYKNVCPKGHEYAEGDLDYEGYRFCRICRNYNAKMRARRIREDARKANRSNSD